LKKIEHLSEIYNHYDTFIIDLWGVMHNGIKLNEKAMNAIENLEKNKKKIFFLSNAPRPSANVVNFLKKLNMHEKYLKNIITSGETAMASLKKEKFGTTFFHLGPVRDTSLFKGLEKNKTSLEKSDFILCTGLFDDREEDLEFYKKLLKYETGKKFICTNPDLTVHRGNKEEYCAGTVAEVFKSLGGKVIYFGKPYKEIYETILSQGKKYFIIGDNLNTDIRGANNLNIDSLFISNGVHRSEFIKNNELEDLLKKYKVKSKFFQPELCW